MTVEVTVVTVTASSASYGGQQNFFDVRPSGSGIVGAGPQGAITLAPTIVLIVMGFVGEGSVARKKNCPDGFCPAIGSKSTGARAGHEGPLTTAPTAAKTAPATRRNAGSWPIFSGAASASEMNGADGSVDAVRALGIGLTEVEGINVATVYVIIAQVGIDFGMGLVIVAKAGIEVGRFPAADQFASGQGLSASTNESNKAAKARGHAVGRTVVADPAGGGAVNGPDGAGPDLRAEQGPDRGSRGDHGDGAQVGTADAPVAEIRPQIGGDADMLVSHGIAIGPSACPAATMPEIVRPLFRGRLVAHILGLVLGIGVHRRRRDGQLLR